MKVKKSTIAKINSNFSKARSSAEDAIKYAIKTGEGLIEAKEKVPHGDWEKWVKHNSELCFDTSIQASKYIKLAKNAQLAMIVSDGTIGGTLKAIAEATPEQKEEAKALTAKLQTKKDSSISNQMSSESNEWYTPDHIIELVFQVMGDIDLDPCSDPEGNVAAKSHFTQEDDGLSQVWQGRVFMNPPYGGSTLAWVDKITAEEEVSEYIVLVASNTDTNYFHDLMQYSYAVCFIKGRLEFKSGEGHKGGRSTVRNVLFYAGKNVEKFNQQFSAVGHVVLTNLGVEHYGK